MFEPRNRIVSLCWSAFAALASATTASAQSTLPDTSSLTQIVSDGATRIADPKLKAGGVEVAFHLEPAGANAIATMQVMRGVQVVANVWSGPLAGGASPTIVGWSGKDDASQWLETGPYDIVVSAPGVLALRLPLDLVRLGITEIEFQDSPAGNDEFQMVYFKKGTTYAFYATPAIHEYLNVADTGGLADLDWNNGDPRSAPPVHTATDSPPLEGQNYEDDRYNFPLAYARGATPRLELTFGSVSCSPFGATSGAGYPVAGFDIRVQPYVNGAAVAPSGPIVPGVPVIVDLLPLGKSVAREDLTLDWTWQYKASADAAWSEVPGGLTTSHRVYTLLGEPNFKAGAVGTQYSGPWVEVCEYLASWKQTLDLSTNDAAGVTEVLIKGFFGQNGGIPTAIEGVRYDAYPLGGDGGASHYFLSGSWSMRLSWLLSAHAGGVFVNCSDCMGATTTMLAMLGLDGVRPVRLGGMTLRAIWGIGAPAYTTNLWGTGHSFAFHHILTDDDGITVSDACMQLDEDGNASATPGIPGWNHNRPWAGPTGYDDLSNTNVVTKSLELLPGLN